MNHEKPMNHENQVKSRKFEITEIWSHTVYIGVNIYIFKYLYINEQINEVYAVSCEVYLLNMISSMATIYAPLSPC